MITLLGRHHRVGVYRARPALSDNPENTQQQLLGTFPCEVMLYLAAKTPLPALGRVDKAAPKPVLWSFVEQKVFSARSHHRTAKERGNFLKMEFPESCHSLRL